MRAKLSKLALACSGAVDTVTVLWTAPGKLATKQFSRNSPKSAPTVKQYDAGHLFSAPNPVGVSNIEELSVVLQFIERQPRALIVRGAPAAEAIIGKDVTRTGSGNGDGFVGNFKTPNVGRHYLAIDVDKYVLPHGLRLNQANIQKICEHIVHLLPQEFHGASYHWQLSSSAGVFNRTMLSAHFWFWLTKPVPDAALKIWARHVNQVLGIKLVDDALFQHVQAHYTAAPIFNGMADPFPVRSGLTVKSSDSVNLQLPPPEVAARAVTASTTATFSASGGSGFEFYLKQIGDHPGGDGFHRPIVQAIASYVSEHGSERTDTEFLYSTVRNRVLAADGSKHSQAEVADRASGTHILSAIASAQRKYGDAAQRRKSRRIEGMEPHFKGEFQAATMIQSSLAAILDKVF